VARVGIVCAPERAAARLDLRHSIGDECGGVELQQTNVALDVGCEDLVDTGLVQAEAQGRGGLAFLQAQGNRHLSGEGRDACVGEVEGLACRQAIEVDGAHLQGEGATGDGNGDRETGKTIAGGGRHVVAAHGLGAHLGENAYLYLAHGHVVCGGPAHIETLCVERKGSRGRREGDHWRLTVCVGARTQAERGLGLVPGAIAGRKHQRIELTRQERHQTRPMAEVVAGAKQALVQALAVACDRHAVHKQIVFGLALHQGEQLERARAVRRRGDAKRGSRGVCTGVAADELEMLRQTGLAGEVEGDGFHHKRARQRRQIRLERLEAVMARGEHLGVSARAQHDTGHAEIVRSVPHDLDGRAGDATSCGWGVERDFGHAAGGKRTADERTGLREDDGWLTGVW
jgi:hypothetical protein